MNDAHEFLSVETERLVGEPVGGQHLEPLASMHDDERVMRTLGGRRTLTETAAMVDRLAAHWGADGFGYWVFFERDTGEFVGRGGLRRVEIPPIGEEVEVGWAVVAERWRQGFATEMAEVALLVAFELLDIDSVVAFTLPHNAASLGVMKRTGFVYERDITWAQLPHVLYRRRRSWR